jgi:secreted trypsin-like serine protease
MLKTLSCLLVLSSPAFAGALDQPVVGGTPVAPGEWPDVVLVVAPNAACTGTLVAPDVVLTAGHCIETHPALVLVDNVDYGAPGGEVIRVTSAIAYPDWQHHYDVGVLVLEHAAAAKPRAIASACTVREHFAAGAPVQLVGFGLTSKTGTGTNTRLHEASLPVLDAECAKDPWCQPSIAPGGEFTAGGQGTDSCFGDSGGPLYLATPHGAALIGVVSRGLEIDGLPCGGGGVYVRADKVVPWIEKVTGRQVARSACDRGKADDADGNAANGGGCSVGSGVLGGSALAIAAVAWLLTVRRRRSTR